MDQFFELLPIIVIILASIAPKILELFQNNSDREEERNAPAETEQQRRIKEEIRRRIEAARQGRQPGQNQTQPAEQQAPPQRKTLVDQPKRALEPAPRQPQSSPPPLTPTANDFPNQSTQPPELKPIETFDPYAAQRDLEAAQERLKSSHRELDKAKRKAKQRPQQQKRKIGLSSTSRAALELEALNASSLRKTLRNKRQIRQAIVLSEVLGKPISMRNS